LIEFSRAMVPMSGSWVRVLSEPSCRFMVSVSGKSWAQNAGGGNGEREHEGPETESLRLLYDGLDERSQFSNCFD
jgi:hypothetical protein